MSLVRIQAWQPLYTSNEQNTEPARSVDVLNPFMSEMLQDKVLVLNRKWRPIEETTVEKALCDIVRGAATAIDTEFMQAMTWNDWKGLAIRPGDHSIRTVNGAIRVPTVICKSSYADMPDKTPKLSKRNRRKVIGERDGKVCQYTGRFAPDGNIDHVDPRSKGGKNTWENMVWSAAEINALKGSLTLEEFEKKHGYKLRRRPTAPKKQPAFMLIRPREDKPDWDMFLMRQ
jgi:5-methylcytosine-specific restriction endonuclease McrA